MTNRLSAADRSAARLDVTLANSGRARSRSHASELIRSGRVRLSGQPVTRPSTKVLPDAPIDVDDDPWVSRGAHKLIGALDESGITVPSVVLDAGACTGGFTQVLLDRGAQRVHAVDVGHDQLAPQLRTDPRVSNHEGLNLRELSVGDLDGQLVDLIVGDVSFISLTLLLGPLSTVLSPDGVALLLVKPQFEVGRRRLGAGGVVRDPADRRRAVDTVVDAAAHIGLRSFWQAPSRVPGPSGNIEYFVGLRRGAIPD
ncbi:23S rRNA (cytidine1920-2'-O)/16S rRNA (cytidine1409-2'-O)-methyltransferase [Propionibacterium cyclohexanicum]|uniref:23S rRNA (Cytidine1920-2'-O)/16S rRNA (Cytidine1409-2'-O)-methyltransferase n=1 Tax=Propionibacterium cyclohexanicum TaxID=64702 RepID=A0A1H9QUG2_9ACTN|nr:23S rRNA (cytidine1920-2'-O)/16S rRNA (cytidine1409-2'-O)-methyltransferase [Propionibacterium cyclohexanicum]